MKKQNRKKHIIGYTLAVAALLGIGLVGVWAYQAPVIAGTPLRLHVIANSDDPYDQQVKLKVRDRVLEVLSSQLEHATSKEEAMAEIQDLLPQLETACADTLQGLADYGLHAELGKAEFPTKSYGNLVLPAGEYDALRVVLGKGEGRNWWCVLFPPLCFVDVTGDSQQVGGQPQEDTVPAASHSRVEVKMKIKEWLGN